MVSRLLTFFAGPTDTAPSLSRGRDLGRRIRTEGPMLVARDVRCLFRGFVAIQRLRRRSWRTAESTGGGGMNARKAALTGTRAG